MTLHRDSLLKSLEGGQGKSNSKTTQLKTIFEFLQKEVATASMVTAETGVVQKNITRSKRDLEKAGRLWEVKKDYCVVTGFKAWYLTTDPKKTPKGNIIQLNLFP
jgi:hypothetical protein